MGVGVDKSKLKHSTRDVLLEQCNIRDAVQFLSELNLAILPANADMTEAEIKLRDVAAGDFALKSALAEVAESYDYVILDCPPALSKLTVNALVAADGRSEEHTSELQSLMRIQYAVFCLKKKTN